MAYQTPDTEEAPEVMKATRARQGSWGRHIFWVLIISIVLAAIALFGSWAFNAPALQGEGGQVRSESAATAFDAPQPAPKIPEAAQHGPDPSN